MDFHCVPLIKVFALVIIWFVVPVKLLQWVVSQESCDSRGKTEELPEQTFTGFTNCSPSTRKRSQETSVPSGNT